MPRLTTPEQGRQPTTAFSKWLADNGYTSADVERMLRFYYKARRMVGKHPSARLVAAWRQGTRTCREVHRVVLATVLRIKRDELDQLLDG